MNRSAGGTSVEHWWGDEFCCARSREAAGKILRTADFMAALNGLDLMA